MLDDGRVSESTRARCVAQKPQELDLTETQSARLHASSPAAAFNRLDRTIRESISVGLIDHGRRYFIAQQSSMENEDDVDNQESYPSHRGPVTARRLSGVRREA
jgi:hypothetical protein